MAQKRKSSAGGGFKGILSTGFVFVILISSLIGWAKVNDITSITAGYNYFKSWSDKAWECGAGDAEWNCKTPAGSGDNGAKDPVAPKPGDPAVPAPNQPPPGSTAPKNQSLETLNNLKISEAQSVDYDRSSWKHWTGNPCDTRETILREQGKNVVSDPKSCKATSGTWIDPYGGKTFTDASKLDIDHVIPLGYAAKHGGQNWSAEKKEQFANDKTQLLVSSAGENRGKSDSGPSNYMPPNKNFHCDYSKIWVSTASQYGISITEGDKRALKAGLQRCSG